VASLVDATRSCSASGVYVEPSITEENYEYSTLQFTGLKRNTRAVIRLDLIIQCDLDCQCSCYREEDEEHCYCGSTPIPRQTHISTAEKRDIEESHVVMSDDIGYDPYQVVLYFTDYYVNGDYFPVSVKLVTFSNLCGVLSCLDYTGCYTGVIQQTGNSYKDRICIFEDVSCDDGYDCTKDVCIPPAVPYFNKPRVPPACIHREICDESNLGGSIGNCYYNYEYNCHHYCDSNDDCKEEGGTCLENPFCSEETTHYCYWKDYGFDCSTPCSDYQDCEGGSCTGTAYCFSDQSTGHCYWEDYGFDCSTPCSDYQDCGDGAWCYVTTECHSSHELQEENSESAKSKQLTGGLTPAQLGGIIAGCVGFVVMVMVVVFIYKKLHQEKFNEDTIITLQVPLN